MLNYGDGAVTNPADGSNYAATQLKLIARGQSYESYSFRQTSCTGIGYCG